MFEMKQLLSNWWEIWLKTSEAVVVLPIPPIPQIPTILGYDDCRHSKDLAHSTLESIPTKFVEVVEGAMAFNFFKVSWTIWSISVASGLKWSIVSSDKKIKNIGHSIDTFINWKKKKCHG